jgi:enterochelin esterase-like enzyme
MRIALRTFLLASLVAAAACAPWPATTSTPGQDVAPTDNQLNGDVTSSTDASAPATPDLQTLGFTSEALSRPMPYSIYLPPDYATTAKRYPVLYMLHGMSGSSQEWSSYGLVDKADKMMRSGDLPPMIIVLPQGDKAYWVDHAGVDKEAWGRYMAKDVVAEVDARFRTIADGSHRAIGGVSMGAHGALQLAMNYPGTFTVVGAHSLVLRPYDMAPTYFGQPADFAKRDPVQMAPAKAELLRSMDLWIDIGDKDPWVSFAQQFDGELASLKVPHTWHMWSGDHSGSYWSAHLTDYLKFYGSSLSRRALVGPAVALRPV